MRSNCSYKRFGVVRRCLVVALLFVNNNNHMVSSHRSCGTPDLTVEDETRATRAMEKWRAAKPAAASTRQGIYSNQITIDVYFHVLQEDNGRPEISESVLLEQFAILNNRFDPTSFQFVLKQITYTQRSSWIGNTRVEKEVEYEIGVGLAQGGPDTMNVYFQPGICPVEIFGYASVPKWRGVYPVNAYSPNDKVVICPDFLVGGMYEDFDLGMTLVHEVGHWLGLQHTFRGSSCTPNDNDFVDDTPQMLEPTYGCPRNKDSCPLIAGRDLVNNYMDYSDDRCMNSFTAGQMERMLAQVAEFRIKPGCDAGNEATVRFEHQFVEQYEQTQWGMVHWGVSGEETEFRLDMDYDFSNRFAVYEDCIATNSLHQFFVNNALCDGLLVNDAHCDGNAALTINGREVARVSPFQKAFSSIFVSATPTQCDGTAVFIDILFDSVPESLTWDLTNAVTGEVIDDFTSSLPVGASEYFFRMADSLLHIGQCLPDGRYTITFRDSSGGDGIDAPTPGYWRVSRDESLIAEGGLFDSVQSHTFTIGDTLSPSGSGLPSQIPSSSPSPSISNPPSMDPSQFPSEAPTMEEEPFCFAGSSAVRVKGRGEVPLRSVSIGDQVLTANDTYEPIYSFGHYSLVTQGAFLQISLQNSTLVVSKDHMVFVSATRSIPASKLRVGDQLIGYDGTSRPVILSIRNVTAPGVLAPFTPSGRIVVDGILASTFVAFQDSEALVVGGISFSYQWLAHSFEFPHRVVCFYLGSCPNEDYYADSGISTWVATHQRIGKWALRQRPIVQVPLLILFIGVMLAFNFCERYIFLAGLCLVTCWAFKRARSPER